MIPCPHFMIILAITFLGPTTATSYTSLDRAPSLFDSRTFDQTKRRLKMEIPERISQIGGDLNPGTSMKLNGDARNINGAARTYENGRIGSSFHSRDHEYKFSSEPLRQVAGVHHKNNHHRNRMHDYYVDGVQIPFETHGERLRRKLDDEKINATQSPSSTQHNDTGVETHGAGGENHVNGTRKQCIKSHTYKLLSTAPSNVTRNNSDSNNMNILDSKNSTNHSVATDHAEPSANMTANKTEDRKLDNKTLDNQTFENQTLDNQTFENQTLEKQTLDSKNETKENSTTLMDGNEKSPDLSKLPDNDTTSKDNDSAALMPKGQAFGLPCNILGQWVSIAGGVKLDIKASQKESKLDIEVVEQPSGKKGFLSTSWKINGNLPLISFANNNSKDTELGGPLVMTASILKDSSDNGEGKVAVFLGECRACYVGVDSVVGTWSIKRLSKDCMDASLSQKEIRDILHREISPESNEQAKTGKNDASKSKDGVDPTVKPHSFRRRSYHWDKRHRRNPRNTAKHA
ncbi:uncharacterized protein LOC124162763 isoform X1 [Ischnura elegans]|uniref:uncharacterized protein LOC124162763 isoform X1 n=1 Tax=Ischnura elegans TaxID=197161 RepID=UPI001ED87C85|nr:uncharacterized protein LOC124162763 isoform X1 [Ischnura elegans]